MKIIRYLDADHQVGYAASQQDGSAMQISGDIFGEHSVTKKPATVAKLLAPIAPTNILCVGLNYRQHAAESKATIPEFPVLFMKLASRRAEPGRSDRPAPPPAQQRSGLRVRAGRRDRPHVQERRRERALDYVLGYTCANDVSARDWQGKWGGSQWCRGKTFDTFAPLGPCLVTPDEIPNPNALAIKLDINGEVLQDWNTDDMIFDVPRLIEFLSGSTTLPAGTVILTGTPHGVGFARKPPRWLKPGDVVTVTIEKIGALTNPVVEESCG